jgi:23S rRNA (guanosine2251-2'-O)-methyltransferase
LLARRRRVREIVLAAGMDPADILDDIIDLADEAKVPIREVGRGKFEAVARSEGAQGVVALAAPLPELDLDELLAAQRSVPFLLAVDSVTDPGNLGAILRSAEAAGVTGVLLPRHRSARLTPTVTKAAAGAIEHLRFASVPGIAAAISRLKDDEVWTVGLDAAGSVSVHDLSVASDAVALVVGAEGTGLSRLVRDRCDVLARIPMQGTVASLNVSAAAAVALFEVARLRAVAG